MMWVRDLAVQNIYIWSLYFGILLKFYRFLLHSNPTKEFCWTTEWCPPCAGLFFSAKPVEVCCPAGHKFCSLWRKTYRFSILLECKKKLLPAVPETMLIINIFYYPYLNKNEKQTASHCQLCRQNFFFKDAIKKPVEFPLIGKISLELIKNVPWNFSSPNPLYFRKHPKSYFSSEFTFCVCKDAQKVRGLRLNLMLQVVLPKS